MIDMRIPDCAVGVPAAVKDANAQYIDALEKERQADVELRAAKQAAEDAPREDHAAAVQAAREDKPAPEPTVGLRQADVARAEARLDAREAVTKERLRALGETITQHSAEWAAGQIADARERQARLLDALDALGREADEFAASVGVLTTLHAPPGLNGGYRFRRGTVASNLLGELRRAVARAVPADEVAEVAA